MKSMVLMPQAVTAPSTRVRAVASFAAMTETYGALPTMTHVAAARACSDWSLMTNGNAIRQAKGLKSFGTRRLGETST